MYKRQVQRLCDYVESGLTFDQDVYKRQDKGFGIVGISLDENADKWKEAITALNLSLIHIFLSPVFNSISKLNYNSAYTAEELRTAAKAGIIDTC